MTIEKARELLGKEAKNMTDEQIEQLNTEMRLFVEATLPQAVDQLLKHIKKSATKKVQK